MRIKFNYYFIFLLSMLGGLQLNAQVSAYPFSQLTTTYIPITGGQVLGSTTSDDQSFVDPAVPLGGATTGIGFPIGFNFTYNGRVYDRFGVNNNGWISLGQSSLTPSVNTSNTGSNYTVISSASAAPAALQNRIGGFSRDIQGQAGSQLRYQTIGTAPNRILVVQWTNYRRFGGAGDIINFQIRLEESVNVIQIVYGTCTATSTANMAPQVGLRGDSNTDFNNRTTTTNWAITTAGAVNTASCTYTNVITPTSGLAFEWGTRYNNDAGVTALLSPVSPLVQGFQPVTIRVKNFGVEPIDTFYVQWRFNGALQNSFAYFGAPIALQQTITCNLGSINFPTGLTADLEFWTNLPNNMQDEDIHNDTFRITVCPGLNGNYTVGTPSSDYPTIAEAIASLYQCGVSGPVTMSLQPGTYSGQQLALVGNVRGASAVNRITFDGGSPAQVTLTHNGSGNKIPTVALDEVQFITIQNMTIATTAASGTRGHAIHLRNQANNNQIIGNTITATWVANIADLIGIVVSASYADDDAEGNNANNLLIQGNNISGGEMGLHIEGDVTIGPIKNISIIDNRITGYDDYGVFADEIDSLHVVGNTITSLTGSTVATGLYLFDLVYYNIERNTIHTRDWGIYLSSTNNPSFGSRARVVNNMVTSAEDDALYLTTVGSTNFFHNTFASRAATATSCNGAYVSSPVSGTLDFRNNIFFTNSTSTASYAFECTVNTTQLDMDNNVFFSGGANTVRYGTTNYTFNNWRTTNAFGHDQNSLNVNPLFVSLPAGNLHIQNANLNAAGDSTLAIAIDIDMENRPSIGTTRPDIGADEILLVANDAIAIGLTNPAAVTCENPTQAVDVVVGNSGIAALTAVNVTVNITGPVTATLTGSYSGSLTTGQNTTINVGSINTTGGGQFCFEIITQMVGDANPTNDTVVICRNIVPAVPTVVPGTACLNQSAQLTTSPAGGVAWYDVPTGGVALSTDDVFTTAALVLATTYYVEVVACGGTTRYPVTASVYIPTPFYLGNDTTICATSFASLAGPTTNVVSYAWNTGEITQAISVQTAGTYTVTITDINGCEASDSKDVLIFAGLTATAVTNTLTCGNAGTGTVDVTIGTGTAPYIFTWSNGETTEDISALNTGTYDLTITDGNACEYTENYTVAGPSSMSFNAINTSSASCGALTDGIVDIEVVGGTAPYTFFWSNGATTEDLTSLTNGSYAVTVIDANGCQANTNAVLNIVNTVAISIDNVTDEAVQLGGAIDISVSGGQAPYFILWNTGLTTATVSGLVAGVYTVTVTDINGCSSTQMVTVDYTIPALVENIEAIQSLNIFPNPTSDFVNIQLELTETVDVRIDIYNMTGQLLQSFNSGNGLSQNYKVDLSQYAGGMYMARMIIGEEVVTAKIVLKK